MSAIPARAARPQHDHQVEGCYHGIRGLLAKPLRSPPSDSSRRRPEQIAHSLSLCYNDIAAVEAAFDAHPTPSPPSSSSQL